MMETRLKITAHFCRKKKNIRAIPGLRSNWHLLGSKHTKVLQEVYAVHSGFDVPSTKPNVLTTVRAEYSKTFHMDLKEIKAWNCTAKLF